MINQRIKEAIDRYVERGVPPGDFLRAVLQNNLRESLGRADDENRENLFEIVKYLHNEVPHMCWGSPEKVLNWLERKNNEREGGMI